MLLSDLSGYKLSPTPLNMLKSVYLRIDVRLVLCLLFSGIVVCLTVGDYSDTVKPSVTFSPVATPSREMDASGAAREVLRRCSQNGLCPQEEGRSERALWSPSWLCASHLLSRPRWRAAQAWGGGHALGTRVPQAQGVVP